METTFSKGCCSMVMETFCILEQIIIAQIALHFVSLGAAEQTHI